MKTIIINSPKHGIKEVLIDDDIYPFVIHWKWGIQKHKNSFYCKRAIRRNGLSVSIKLHRFIFGETDTAILIDHIDHNGLNCQMSNMRRANHSQNAANRKSAQGRSSKYLGVSIKTIKDKKLKKEYKYWHAQLKYGNKIISFGYFKDEVLAAQAYDEGAKKYHKEFANLNFK